MKAGAIERLKGEKASGRKILVVDNDEGIRTALVDVLRLFGHEAEAVESGEEALAAFDEARHALLITDQHMPGMQGTELIRALRRRCPSLPMIAMTAAGSEGELRTAGACEILRKPCGIAQIEKSVERGLKGEAGIAG